MLELLPDKGIKSLVNPFWPRCWLDGARREPADTPPGSSTGSSMPRTGMAHVVLLEGGRLVQSYGVIGRVHRGSLQRGLR